MNDLETLRYPVGRPPRDKGPFDAATRAAYIATLEEAPARFRKAVEGLTDAELDTAYRPGGWTIRQLVHHMADSHMNGYIRMKLAATEDRPTVKTYDQDRWAELPEARTGPVDVSLTLFEALHRRWVAFLRGLSEADLRRAFQHVDWGQVTIEEALPMYAWHCRHHLAHIQNRFATRRGTSGE